VPGTDVDRYPVDVDDRPQLLCDGTVRLTLVAPVGVAQELTVFEGGRVVGTAGSTNGHPATVALRESSCFGDDSTRFEVRVTTVSGLSARSYSLEVSGSF
jgi:hypothetical protein